jgi:hypothetical protein
MLSVHSDAQSLTAREQQFLPLLAERAVIFNNPDLVGRIDLPDEDLPSSSPVGASSGHTDA